MKRTELHINYCENNGLSALKRGLGRLLRSAFLFSICLYLGHSLSTTAMAADEDHDHDHDVPTNRGKPPGGAPQGKPKTRQNAPAELGSGRVDDGCSVSPQGLADFANGERYDYGNLVTFLTSSGCAPVARQVSLAAISYGVTFSDRGQFRLEALSRSFPKSDLESARQQERTLANTIPTILRNSTLSSSELLPIVGQLSILSPAAGRSALANVMQKELSAADRRMQEDGLKARDGIALDIAKTMVKLGAGEGVMAAKLAEELEEQAVMAQADSLTRSFRALAAAANVEASLIPTFNLAAGALTRGVQRGQKIYSEEDRAQLMATLFAAVKASLTNTGALENGAAQLNEGLSALLGGKALTSTRLRSVWKQAVKILTLSPSQTALAEAIAFSITPQVVFLSPADKEPLLQAAQTYPEIAESLQRNFLLAWKKIARDFTSKRFNRKYFVKMRDKYLEPMVNELLDLDPMLVNQEWLATVVRFELVDDGQIEKRFPRLVLNELDRREKAGRLILAQSGPEPVVQAMAENMSVMWTLSSVELPALFKWVKKYEEKEEAPATE